MKCLQCEQEFYESEQEKKLRNKIAPQIGGEKFELPEPDKCPLCREQNRIAFRNERKLYKRKCSICDKEIISIYSPDKEYTVACNKCFWSDKNDSLSVGRSYDPDEKFFDQFDKLMHKAPLLALFVKNAENSDFVNQEEDIKSCYLTFGGHFNESSMYTTYGVQGFKNVDCYFVFDSKYLYESIYSFSCNTSQYLTCCENCNDCLLCSGCVGCNNCIGCENLNRKQYYYFNKPISKEEYEAKIKEIFTDRKSFKAEKNKFEEFSKQQPKKYSFIKRVENSTGDYLTDCNNTTNSFWVEGSEDGKNLYLAAYVKSTLDLSSIAWADFIYQCIGSTKLNNCIGDSQCIACPDCFYCSNCQNSNHLFGCVGLNHKQYCILNKQYSKEDYDRLTKEIVRKMIKDGDWGRFFPIQISPFGYNETVAMEYFRIEESDAEKHGWQWQENDFGIKYDGPFYQPKEISVYDPKQNRDAQKEIDLCLGGILKCEMSGRPFRIIPQELAQYVEQNIQLPTRHPDQRHLDRLARMNTWRLYHRKCMNEGCNNEFETTYSPDREEKVYCEKCYQGIVN